MHLTSAGACPVDVRKFSDIFCNDCHASVHHITLSSVSAENSTVTFRHTMLPGKNSIVTYRHTMLPGKKQNQ